MFIFNVLLTHEFHSPKLQFVKYQCLFSIYYHYANSSVLSHNLQWSMLCIINVLSCIINVFFPRKGREALRQSLTVFRCLTIDREPSKIPANYADSAQFTHIAHELRKIRTNC